MTSSIDTYRQTPVKTEASPEQSDSIHSSVSNSRRGFLRNSAMLGVAVGLGITAESVMAAYEIPGAVLAEPNSRLQGVWRGWHEPNNSSRTKNLYLLKMDFNSSSRIAWPDSVYETSHIYYLLEAKMGLANQSHTIANDILRIKNSGLNSFRDGCVDFFEYKNYQGARLNFSAGLFTSANLTPEQRRNIQNVSTMKLSQKEIEGAFAFATKACRHFISASVDEKEEILQYLISTGLDSQEELNLYWNLGFYILSEYVKGNKSLALDLRNDKKRTYQKYFKRNVKFNTANGELI